MKALVLSGGGSKGAYQVGALKYILGELKISYDAFCGISVGAINSAFLGQFTYGEEQLSINELCKLWSRVETKKIYKRWFPFGILHGFWLPSLKNSRPLLNWIESELDINKVRNSGKIVKVGAVSLNTGEYKLFDQNYADFHKAVAASSSFPGYLIPIEIENQIWSDGGIKEITPLQAAIDLGADEIDVIITSPEYDISTFDKKPNAINVLKRTLDLMSDEIMANDIDKALLYNKLVKANLASDKRYIKLNIIRPEKVLIDDSLDFSPSKIKEMMDIGYSMAKSKYIL
jgi:NTE family protein